MDTCHQQMSCRLVLLLAKGLDLALDDARTASNLAENRSTRPGTNFLVGCIFVKSCTRREVGFVWNPKCATKSSCNRS